MERARRGSPKGKIAPDELLQMIGGSWKTQAICVAARLGIADHLAGGPLTCSELAAKTNTHAPSLRRLLRALTTINICRELENESFEMTEMGERLGATAPGSLKFWAVWWGEYLWPVWGNLAYSIRTGKSARSLLTKQEGFDHLDQNAEAADAFNRAMQELTRLATTDILDAYDFSGFKRVADIGGGYGQLLLAILTACPQTEGVLFDLPHALQGAKRLFGEAGVAGRCEFVEGNFLDRVVPGCDAYILKSVLHNWDDEKGRLILENCRKVMDPRGRLLIVDRILPRRFATSPTDQAAARSDLNMLAALASRERTLAEFERLLISAGFDVLKFVQTGEAYSVIEALPAPPSGRPASTS